MKRKIITMVAVVVIVMSLIPLRLVSTAPSTPLLIMRVCHMDGSCEADSGVHKIHLGEFLDFWIFVKNPLDTLETAGTPRESIHVVKVNYLTVTIAGPPGTVNGGTFTFPNEMNQYRWNPVVYPMETSRVFFIGWAMDPAADPSGKYKFTYLLNVDFEGKNMDLVKTFKVDMVAP